MSASMAEVLGTHAAIGSEVDDVPAGEIWCNNIACGFKMKASAYEYDDIQDFAAHQAEQLAANGYGKLEDAWDAGAWAYETRRARDESLPLTNPYRRPE